MPDILGRWKVDTGQFLGLTYIFNKDNTFVMEMSMYGVRGTGTFSVNTGKTPPEIDIDFKEHTSGAAGIGLYKGIWEIEDNFLKMKVGTANGDRWTDPSAYIKYLKVE